MWAEDILSLSETQLRESLRNAKRQMKMGNPDYQWPNIGLILGHGANAWETQCHKIVDPATLITRKRTPEEVEMAKGELGKILGLLR